MRNQFLRSVSLILAVLITGSVLISCAENKENTPPETDTSAVQETVNIEEVDLDSVEGRALISDDLPEYDAKGGVYRIMTNNDGSDKLECEEEQTGDIVDDAVYDRNHKVMERFNVQLEIYLGGNHRECGAAIQTAVLSDDDSFDMYAGHAIVSGGAAVNNVFRNWNEMEYINFEKPWWSKNSVEALQLNNVILLMPSYMTSSVVEGTYCMYYNKNIAADYNLPNIYDVVFNKEWTLEKLRSTVEGIYEDLDGNGKQNPDDKYGLAITSLSPAVTFTWAFNCPIVSFDPDDYTATIEFASQSTYDKFTALYDLYYNTEGVTVKGDDHGYAGTVFAKGNTLLAPGTFGYATNTLRDFEPDYAIIPYPKYDENQDNYYSMIDGYHAICGIPKTIRDEEKCGIITEAMTAESWKKVIPAYYDVALKVKGTRDEESVEILDLILDSVVVDFSYIFDNWEGLAFTFQTLLQGKKSDFASYIERNTKKSIRYYEKVVKAFVEYGE